MMIKHTFNTVKGPQIEVLIKETDTGVVILKKIKYADGICEYTTGDYYLTSFDRESQYKDYPIEEVMDSLFSEEPTIKNTFWDHN